jgi:sulfate transport system permease protein
MADTKTGVPVRPRAQDDPLAVRAALILTAVLIMAFLVVVPLVNVFVQAFAAGPRAYLDNLFGNADTLDAIKLTLTVAPIAVGMNLVFGLAAAWAIRASASRAVPS